MDISYGKVITLKKEKTRRAVVIFSILVTGCSVRSAIAFFKTLTARFRLDTANLRVISPIRREPGFGGHNATFPHTIHFGA